jgi:hypothetical protein
MASDAAARRRLHQVPDPAAQTLLAVVRDFLPLAAPPGSLQFYGPATPQYQLFVAGEPAPADVEVLGVTETHSFRLTVGDDPAALAVRAASVLQDDVMDDLGAPWPQVVAGEDTLVVLEPVVSEHGDGRWAGGGLSCAIGALHQCFEPLFAGT